MHPGRRAGRARATASSPAEIATLQGDRWWRSVTKIDLVDRRRAWPSSCSRCRSWATSPTWCRSRAVSGDQLDVLVDVMAGHLPPSPRLYPDDMITDEPEQVMVAELIREAALEGVRDELPHSIAVVVEEMIPAEDATT